MNLKGDSMLQICLQKLVFKAKNFRLKIIFRLKTWINFMWVPKQTLGIVAVGIFAAGNFAKRKFCRLEKSRHTEFLS